MKPPKVFLLLVKIYLRVSLKHLGSEKMDLFDWSALVVVQVEPSSLVSSRTKGKCVRRHALAA